MATTENGNSGSWEDKLNIEKKKNTKSLSANYNQNIMFIVRITREKNIYLLDERRGKHQ